MSFPWAVAAELLTPRLSKRTYPKDQSVVVEAEHMGQNRQHEKSEYLQARGLLFTQRCSLEKVPSKFAVEP